MEKSVKEWLAMGDEDRLKASTYYKSHYEGALAFYEQEGPPWEELTHEQRDNVRRECIRYAREMDGLAERLIK